MRILFLIPGAQLGGAERCLLDCLASLRRTEPGWNLHLIAGENGPLLARARELGVTAECLACPPVLGRLGSFDRSPAELVARGVPAIPALMKYGWRLMRAIRQNAPEIIHTHGIKMHLLAAWVTRQAPVIWHLHDYVSRRGLLTRALQWSHFRCAGAIAVSTSVADDASRRFPKSAVLKTILNGVDLNTFHPRGPAAALDSLSTKPRTTIRVGLLATFARWKGHEVFLGALAHPTLRGLDIHAFITGGAIYRTEKSQYSTGELEALAERLQVRQRVTFTGFVTEPAATLRALDIVVHASTAPEPFGLAIAEALACGRPVIAARAGGAAEVLDDDRCGIVTQPGDADALAAAIARLYHDGITRLRMGRFARQRAELLFDRDRLGPALASFYREVRPACEFSTSTAAISTAA